MKKLYFILIISLLSLGSLSVLAQTPQFYNNNTGTSNNNWPLNAASNINNKCQWIYPPAVFSTLGGGLGAPAYNGLITDIYFRMGGPVNPNSTYNISLSLGQNVGTIPTFANGTYITGLTPVFVNPSYSLTGVVAWNWYKVTLPTPILYNPALSMVFEMFQTGTGGGNRLAQNLQPFGTRIYGP